jgi:hypothetical protein
MNHQNDNPSCYIMIDNVNYILTSKKFIFAADCNVNDKNRLMLLSAFNQIDQ